MPALSSNPDSPTYRIRDASEKPPNRPSCMAPFIQSSIASIVHSLTHSLIPSTPAVMSSPVIPVDPRLALAHKLLMHAGRARRVTSHADIISSTFLFTSFLSVAPAGEETPHPPPLPVLPWLLGSGQRNSEAPGGASVAIATA